MYTNRVFGLLALLFIVLQVADIHTTANIVQIAGTSFEFIENDVRMIEGNPLMRHMIDAYGFQKTGMFKIFVAVIILIILYTTRTPLNEKCLIMYCASGMYFILISAQWFTYYFY